MIGLKNELLNKYRENAFFLSLIIVAAVFPFSEALVSIAVGLLFFQTIALQSWNHPAVKWETTKVALFPVSIFIIYLIGTIFTNDFPVALYELKKNIFWLVVPMAIFLSPTLHKKQTYLVLSVFVLSVTVASLIFTGKLILNSYFQVADFRSISIVSHIRYSLQVVLSIILVSWFLYSKTIISLKINSAALWFLLVWLVIFLFLLKSLIGIFSFLGVLLVFIGLLISKTKDQKHRIGYIVLFGIAVLFPLLYVGSVVYDFYDFENIHPEEVEQFTPAGNLYQHDFNQGLRENGHLVNIYICEEELRQEWNKRSSVKYDDDLNGYFLGSTLIRYLTSKGYRKDSVGVSKLTAEDIDLILKGVTNYKFKNQTFSIYPRVYETVWELDNYRRTGDPNQKTLAQRIEFIKASLILIQENPVFGVGTGNWVKKYNEAYDKMNTLLLSEKRASSHNQYLNYLVKFGFVGFSWILIAILIPVFRQENRYNYLLILLLFTYAFANLGDANLESHMGLSFFTFFYAFFLRNSTTEMKKFLM